jgi:uncharacterized membrane protein
VSAAAEGLRRAPSKLSDHIKQVGSLKVCSRALVGAARPITRSRRQHTCSLDCASRLRKSSAEDIKRRALRQDGGKWAVLLPALVAATASLVVIASEMPLVKNANGVEQAARVVYVIFTIVLSWAFMHTMFALHYAHVGTGRFQPIQHRVLRPQVTEVAAAASSSSTYLSQ